MQYKRQSAHWFSLSFGQTTGSNNYKEQQVPNTFSLVFLQYHCSNTRLPLTPSIIAIYSGTSVPTEISFAMPSRTPNILKPDVRPHNGIDGDILYEDEEYRNADDDSVDEDEDEVGDNQNKFRPRPSLPDSDVFKRSLGDLMVLMDGPYLDLNPDYQRDVVWTSQRMTGLINSLIGESLSLSNHRVNITLA